MSDTATGGEMGDYGTGKGAPIPSVSNADLQRENAALRERLAGVERVCLDVLHDRAKHDVDILLGSLAGILIHVKEHDDGANDEPAGQAYDRGYNAGFVEGVRHAMIEIGKLREIVRALTEAEDAGIAYQRGRWYEFVCRYCGAEGDTPSLIEHVPDCPITRGRAALLNIDRQWEQARAIGKEFGAEQEGADDGE